MNSQRLMLAAFLVAILPTTAAVAYDESYPDCLNSPIENRRLTDSLQHRDDGAIRIGTLGNFFVVSYNNTGPRGLILGDVLSIEIPEDAIAVEACLDGNVTFTFAPVEIHEESIEEPVHTHETEEITDLIQWWIEWGYPLHYLPE